MVQYDEVRCQSPRVAEQCDVNTHSLTRLKTRRIEVLIYVEFVVAQNTFGGMVWKLEVSKRININVALFSYLWVFGDGPRNFGPWSKRE
ncbi:hypothetical protein TNCV_1792481 [Trichonephila clavipes]|nr:hypothetical protein TNCV_1792481 [Trichonephila clavipes]